MVMEIMANAPSNFIYMHHIYIYTYSQYHIYNVKSLCIITASKDKLLFKHHTLANMKYTIHNSEMYVKYMFYDLICPIFTYYTYIIHKRQLKKTYFVTSMRSVRS